jgi:hypothetical protein
MSSRLRASATAANCFWRISERQAPVIGLRGLADECECLARQIHEVEGDTFPRRPADRFASDGGSMPGQDDCAEPVHAGGMQGFCAVATNTQRTAPNLKRDAVFREEQQGFQGFVMRIKKLVHLTDYQYNLAKGRSNAPCLQTL